MARIAVDIDGVIATTLKNGVYPQDYPKKKPIPMAKEALKVLLDKGHTVYLFTARYEEDREITEQWLAAHGFKGLYDELVMAKPKYDIIIDDRAIRYDNWMDVIGKIGEMDREGVYHNDTSNQPEICK